MGQAKKKKKEFKRVPQLLFLPLKIHTTQNYKKKKLQNFDFAKKKKETGFWCFYTGSSSYFFYVQNSVLNFTVSGAYNVFTLGNYMYIYIFFFQ